MEQLRRAQREDQVGESDAASGASPPRMAAGIAKRPPRYSQRLPKRFRDAPRDSQEAPRGFKHASKRLPKSLQEEGEEKESADVLDSSSFISPSTLLDPPLLHCPSPSIALPSLSLHYPPTLLPQPSSSTSVISSFSFPSTPVLPLHSCSLNTPLTPGGLVNLPPSSLSRFRRFRGPGGQGEVWRNEKENDEEESV